MNRYAIPFVTLSLMVANQTVLKSSGADFQAVSGGTSLENQAASQVIAQVSGGNDSSSGASATATLESETPVAASQARTVQTAVTPPAHKTTMLYGRIEQIAGQSGAAFPVLKAQTPKMDLRAAQPPLRAQATERQLSGTVVNNFPQDYSGNWGGTLSVWRFEQSPVAYQVDPDEAKWTAQAIKQGAQGLVNFKFSHAANGKIALEPAQICFMVPMKDTYASEQVNQMMGGMNNGQMGGMMQQMMGSMADSMKVPVVMQLGNFETSGLVTGVSGNQLRSALLKNEIRELSPGVLEQQLVTSQVERNTKSGKVVKSYGETILRFTKQTSDQFYVQAAIVSFTEDRQFEEKSVLYGTVRKGVVVQNNPDPMAGFGDLNKLMGAPGSGQMPQLSPGQNPFQNLFQP
jgi:hypothetical protein